MRFVRRNCSLSRREALRLFAMGTGTLFACSRAEDAAPTTDEVTPPTPNETGSTMMSNDPSDAPSPFQFEFFSTHGRRVAKITDSGPAFDLFERTTWLRIRSDVSGFIPPAAAPSDDERTGFVPPAFDDDGLAVMVQTGLYNEIEDESIGLFADRLDAREIEQLRRTIEFTPWAELPRPVGGDFNAPQMAIRYSSGDLLIQRQFNAWSSNFVEAIKPLWDLLDVHMNRLGLRAAATMVLRLRVDQSSDDPRQHVIHLRLENEGTGAVVLTDPRVPSDVDARLEVRVGELVDAVGVPPFEWTVLPLPGLPEGEPRSLVIGAKSHFEISVPWVASKTGKFEIRGTWVDYMGPSDPVAGQLPFMPLPERGPSAVGTGPYPIRGSRASSHYLEVKDPPKKR
jgi:hypothetical protein